MYEYRAMPVAIVLGLVSALDRPGIYISDDAELRAYRNVLAGGFRWVRTDGEWAIFERFVSKSDDAPEAMR
jgi:hypothetical protein